MRIRVNVDTRFPLRRWKKIKLANGCWGIVHFQYEFNSYFCYICGYLGHTDVFCPKRFDVPDGEMKKEWEAWLKFDSRRSGE